MAQEIDPRPKSTTPQERVHSVGDPKDSPHSPLEGAKTPTSVDPLARLRELQAIAKNVALDAGLEVKLGEEGGGSFCAYGRPSGVQISRRDRSITIDPNHILMR